MTKHSCFPTLATTVALSLALLVAGCGAATPPASARPSGDAAAKLVPVNLRLQFLVAGYDAPFILAQARGLYAKAGLNVHILEGKSSASTAETVANGSDTFGITDASTEALLVSKGVPIKLVADYLQSSPVCFISHVPLNSPKDLVGKQLIGTAGSNNVELLPAVLAKAGLSMNDVTLDTTSPASEPQLFARNPNGVMLGVAVGNALAALKLDPKASVTVYSKFGINTLSFGLVTSTHEIQADPQLVRRFVAASAQGWQLAMKDPTAAVDATLKAFPTANRYEIAQGLTMSLPLLHTSASRGQPLGWMAASDWQSTLALLHRYGGMQKVLPATDYYTNDFIAAA